MLCCEVRKSPRIPQVGHAKTPYTNLRSGAKRDTLTVWGTQKWAYVPFRYHPTSPPVSPQRPTTLVFEPGSRNDHISRCMCDHAPVRWSTPAFVSEAHWLPCHFTVRGEIICGSQIINFHHAFRMQQLISSSKNSIRRKQNILQRTSIRIPQPLDTAPFYPLYVKFRHATC